MVNKIEYFIFLNENDIFKKNSSYILKTKTKLSDFGIVINNKFSTGTARTDCRQVECYILCNSFLKGSIFQLHVTGITELKS